MIARFLAKDTTASREAELANKRISECAKPRISSLPKLHRFSSSCHACDGVILLGMPNSLSKAHADTQPLIFKKWLFLADKLEVDPELLRIPLENIKNWRANGRLADMRFLDQWEEMITVARASDEGMEALLAFVRKNGEQTRAMKSCSPFAGVLTRDERDLFTCAWTH